MATSDSTTTTKLMFNQEQPTEPAYAPLHHRSPHDLPPDIQPPQPLEHKLMVKSADGKVTNLLCPIELVLESQNYSAPLIPPRYDPEFFCLFQNVQSNSFKATTPRAASRKRKSDGSLSRNPKKRKKMQHKAASSKSLHNISGRPHEDVDESLHDNYFQYEPTLNVNSRPKRQRKKVSYTEPDPNHIPVHYVKAKATANPKNGSKATKSKQSTKSTKATKSTKSAATTTVNAVQKSLGKNLWPKLFNDIFSMFQCLCLCVLCERL